MPCVVTGYWLCYKLNVSNIIKEVLKCFVQSKKYYEASGEYQRGITVFSKFCDFFPNLDFLLLYGYKKIFCSKFKGRLKKNLHFKSVFDFLIFVPKTYRDLKKSLHLKFQTFFCI